MKIGVIRMGKRKMNTRIIQMNEVVLTATQKYLTEWKMSWLKPIGSALQPESV